MSNPRAEPCVLVIFGASGDLTRRKLFPALENLREAGLLPERFGVLGVARQRVEAGAVPEGIPFESLAGEFADPALFTRISAALATLTSRHHIPPNYLFYLAVPPDLFGPVAHQLANAGLTRQDDGWRRIVVEKPFGYDLESARRLNAELTQGLRESQIYRIDHYLGKETVQNILAFRFANGIFEPIWNRRYVDHVQMTVAEEDGIGTRAVYYDKSGALRDMVQNHMFQLLTLVAMEPPISFRAEAVRDEKVKVLDAILPLSDSDVRRYVVRGQYASYQKEPNVPAGSLTETFVALRLYLDNWRWAGVPFYLRTGKKLPRRSTELSIHFKRAPFMLFRQTPVECTNPNVLVLRIQPNEGISLSFDAKVPGPLERLHTVTMDFSYAEYFKAEPATGYETLLYDAMTGDQTLFHRMDIVEAGWAAVQPILDVWSRDRGPVPTYPDNSWGPAESDVLVEHDGREWRE